MLARQHEQSAGGRYRLELVGAGEHIEVGTTDAHVLVERFRGHRRRINGEANPRLRHPVGDHFAEDDASLERRRARASDTLMIECGGNWLRKADRCEERWPAFVLTNGIDADDEWPDR
jgi:hypothetical protein